MNEQFQNAKKRRELEERNSTDLKKAEHGNKIRRQRNRTSEKYD